MPGSAFNPAGFGRRAAAIAIGAVLAAGGAGVGWWQTHLSTSPACVVAAPTAGAVLVGNSRIDATCGSTTVLVEFEVDNAVVATTSSLPFSLPSWNSATVVDGTHLVSVTAVGTDGSIVTSASVSVTTNNGVTSSGTAHVWISSSGTSGCTRSGTLVSYSTAVTNGNVCDTGPHAYQVAQAGDTILTQTMTVTTQWSFTGSISKTITAGTCNYNYGGASNFTNCITIKPDTGQSLTFNCTTGACAGTGYQVPGAQVIVCVNGLSIQNATWTESDFTSTVTQSNAAIKLGKADATCLAGGAPPHDNYYNNNVYGGQVTITGGAANIWVVGGTAASTTDWPWQFGGSTCLNTGPCAGYSLPVNHGGIVGVTFNGSSFVNGDPSGHHMECVHGQGGDENNTFAADQFDSCPIEGLFLEADGASSSGGNTLYDANLVENSYFVGGSALVINCHATGCSVTNNIVRFSSFSGGSALLYGDCASSCTIDNNKAYGNVAVGCGSITTHTGTGWLMTYNVQSVTQTQYCAGDATSAYSATVTYVGAPNLDLSGAQTATNFVPNSVTWPLSGQNIHGTTRSGATTNAGAD